MNFLEKIKKVDINQETINTFDNNDDFSAVGVELAKELGQVVTILVCSRLSESYYLDRNIAIIYGLGIRLYKLYNSILENYCNRKAEIIQILQRCLMETYIDLLCFEKSKDEKDFDNYIKNSLSGEGKLLKHIEENIEKRGFEKPIETRMKKSILYCCDEAGVTSEEVKKLKTQSWKFNSIYNRFEHCEREKMYDSYRMCSHSIHGTWVDIQLWNIVKTENGYITNPDWNCPDLRLLMPISILLCDGMIAFTKLILNQDIGSIFIERLNDIQKRALILNSLHEKFIRNI